MAIDRNKTKELLESINDLFEQVTGSLPAEAKNFIKTTVMGPVYQEIHDLIDESRPPVLFLIGRSGHGKSSIINALANKKVAEVSDIKPGSPGSDPYEIIFEDRYATWTVVDSRGIFESTKPDGADEGDAVQILKQDLIKYKPDVIMHVISAPEVRALANDLIVFKDITTMITTAQGISTPTIVVINKVDTLGNPMDWPPEVSAKKAGLIKDVLNYMTLDVLDVNKFTNIDKNVPIKGYAVSDETYIGIIPTRSLQDEDTEEKYYWNINTLSDFIGTHLPKGALLDFYQAQKRKEQLKRLSTSLIKRFSVISGGIGASPIPLSDIAVLVPLQMIMIAIIGGLSCRELSKKTATEFLVAAGLDIAIATGAREVARQFLKFIPVIGWAGSGAIASAGTYAVGKAAEAYFFSGEIINPDKFKSEWN